MQRIKEVLQGAPGRWRQQLRHGHVRWGDGDGGRRKAAVAVISRRTTTLQTRTPAPCRLLRRSKHQPERGGASHAGQGAERHLLRERCEGCWAAATESAAAAAAPCPAQPAHRALAPAAPLPTAGALCCRRHARIPRHRALAAQQARALGGGAAVAGCCRSCRCALRAVRPTAARNHTNPAGQREGGVRHRAHLSRLLLCPLTRHHGPLSLTNPAGPT